MYFLTEATLGENFKSLQIFVFYETTARTGKKMQDSKVVPSYLLAQYTHSLVSDQVMFNGGSAIILLDPVDLKRIAPVLDLDL